MAGSTLELPETEILYAYLCSVSRGNPIVVTVKFKNEVWTMWKGNVGHTVADKYDAEKEMCEDWQKVVLFSKVVSVSTALNEVIQDV